MKLRRIFNVYYVLGMIMLAFSVSMVFSFSNVRKYEQLAQSDIMDATWIVSQAEIELTRFLYSLDVYMYSDVPLVTKEDVVERMEIFWSRLPLFIEGREGKRFAEIFGTQEAARGAMRVLERLEPAIVSLEHSDRAAYEKIRGELHGLLSPLQKLLTDARRWQEGAAAIRGERLNTVYAELIVASLGIILSGGFLVLLLLHEIRQSRRAQMAEARAMTQLSEAIESHSDGFSLFDKDDRLVMCNQRFRDMHQPAAEVITTGIRFEDLVTAYVGGGLIPEAIGDEEGWIERRMRRHLNPTDDFEVKYQDGRWFRVSERKTRDGGCVSIRADITALKQRQEDLADQQHQADSANKAKTDFLLTMSHELRTPLNAIMGFSEVMKHEMRGPLGNDSYVEYSRDIYDSANHLLAVINNILDISRVEAGRLELDEQAVVLEIEVERAMRQLEDEARIADIKLIRDVEPELPLLLGDAHKIQQIVINLAGNAVRYLPAGGEVTVSVNKDTTGGIVLRVADNGEGMSPEDVERVLSPFVRLSNPMVRQHDGTGLGLPLVKALVELHGGTFVLDSTLGAGTTATASFPKSRVILPEPLAASGGSSP